MFSLTSANKLYVLICSFIALAIMFMDSSQASLIEDDAQKEAVTSGWFYHWGDLPKNSRTGQWDFASSQWQPTESPSAIPGRQGEKIVWLKITLPSRSWRDPHLFIGSVDLTLQVFLAQRLIYQFGDIDEQGNSRFEGWPWHSIRLPDDYSQHSLYLRIFSNYADIGLFGEVVVGERFEVLNTVYQRGFTGLLFILVLVVAGVISSIMGAIKRDGYVAISTGLLSFDLALMMFAENEVSQLVWFEPLYWRYIAAFSYFLIPVLLVLVKRSWHKEATLTSSWVLAISVAFIIGVALMSIFTPISFVHAYPYFDLLFIGLVLALMVSDFRLFFSQGLPGRLMAFGILTLFVSLLLDMMSAHGVIDWIGRTGQWGLIIFALTSLTIYLLQDWQQQKHLNWLTLHLESEVQARTQELKLSQGKMAQLAREDSLTLLLNRRAFAEQAETEVSKAIRHQHPLSLILFDIDHFKEINDTYGHSTGDRVLKAIASATRETCRESDLICRYGGEEFVILLHAADSMQASILAARLRESVNGIEVKSNDDQTISITASFGLVCVDNLGDVTQPAGELLERLLCAADRIMYEVKASGRDGVKVHNLTDDKTTRQRAYS